MFISIQSALTQCSGEATSATRISASIRIKVSVLVKVVFVQIVESESIGPSKSCFPLRKAFFQNELSNTGYKFHKCKVEIRLLSQTSLVLSISKLR